MQIEEVISGYSSVAGLSRGRAGNARVHGGVQFAEVADSFHSPVMMVTSSSRETGAEVVADSAEPLSVSVMPPLLLGPRDVSREDVSDGWGVFPPEMVELCASLSWELVE